VAGFGVVGLEDDGQLVGRGSRWRSRQFSVMLSVAPSNQVLVPAGENSPPRTVFHFRRQVKGSAAAAQKASGS
jgi:hypothetical protein